MRAVRALGVFACTGLLLAAFACDSEGDDDDDDCTGSGSAAGTSAGSATGTGTGSPSGSATGTGSGSGGGGGAGGGGATVSGSANRTIGTCPPHDDGFGDLCVSLRGTCDQPATEVANTVTADQSMAGPESSYVDFELTGVPDGTWHIYALFDDDESGCDALTTGDFHLAAGCVEVTVTGGQDVSNVEITFDQRYQ